MYQEFIEKNPDKFKLLRQYKDNSDLIERRKERRRKEKLKRVEEWRKKLNEEQA